MPTPGALEPLHFKGDASQGAAAYGSAVPMLPEVSSIAMSCSGWQAIDEGIH
jgi:hypothetical protein